ncbi:MAG TPA: HlyD family efflux transporter periplasmic adaptor subunit [Terriglobales bacterium]|nr:HlyD family efflux transporter periplasmic adaptor subunit [Terriglobales bacterium]
MNLTEAFNTALPDIPALSREFLPKLRPNLLAREHVVRGTPVVVGVLPESGMIYRWTPEEWELLKLFDGVRTLEQISELHAERTGVHYSVEVLREIVEVLDEQDFWYKTPLEQNVALQERLAEERLKKAKRKSKYGDVADLRLIYWNPDNYLHAIYPHLKFIYSRWFTVASFLAMGFTVYILADQWDRFLADTFRFYTFTLYTPSQWAVFWLLTCFVLFIHESAHGLACVHYGGHVYKMGFNLIYLSPAFYTEAQQIFVLGNKWQRLNTIVWGVWSELLLFFVVTPIWWGTPPGSAVREVCYMLMLVTGVAVILINWNPLIKLDGYYVLTELLELPMLKEESTAYVTSWVKKNIWRLPVEVPFVPRRRRLGYVVYCLLSGVYSYSLLLFVTRLVGRIATSYSPEWGFLVGLAVGYRIFRSRIHAFGRLMKAVYLDKKDRVRLWFTPRRRWATALVSAVVLFTPFWRESVEGRFVLEPRERAVVRVVVPGWVAAVQADEGQTVAAGATLARLQNLQLETENARARADYRLASNRAAGAYLQYAAFGVADQERRRLQERSRDLEDQYAQLELKTPIAGTILTPRVRDRLGSYLEAGTELAEIADITALRARTYVPEFRLRKAKLLADADLLLESSMVSRHGKVVAIAPVSVETAPGGSAEAIYKGIGSAKLYACEVLVDNPDRSLRPGMSGTAKIYGERRSLAGLIWEPVRNFVSFRVW